MGNLAGLFSAATIAMSFTIVARNRERDLLPSFVLGGVLAMALLYPVPILPWLAISTSDTCSSWVS